MINVGRTIKHHKFKNRELRTALVIVGVAKNCTYIIALAMQLDSGLDGNQEYLYMTLYFYDHVHSNCAWSPAIYGRDRRLGFGYILNG